MVPVQLKLQSKFICGTWNIRLNASKLNLRTQTVFVWTNQEISSENENKTASHWHWCVGLETLQNKGLLAKLALPQNGNENGQIPHILTYTVRVLSQIEKMVVLKVGVSIITVNDVNAYICISWNCNNTDYFLYYKHGTRSAQITE